MRKNIRLYLTVIVLLLLTLHVSGSGLTAQFDARNDSLTNFEKLAFLYDIRLPQPWQAINDPGKIGAVKAKAGESISNGIRIYNHEVIRGNMKLTLPKVPVLEGQRYHLSFKTNNRSTNMAWLLADIYFYNKDGNQVWRVFREFESFSIRKNEVLEYGIDFEVPRTGGIVMQINFQFGGDSFEAILGEIDLVKSVPKAVMNRHQNTFSLFTGNDLKIWSDLVQHQTPFEGVPDGLKLSPLKMAAAGNETESIQVILSPEKKLQQINFGFTPLKNTTGATLPADIWRFRRIGYLNIPESAGSAKSGMRPDVLFEETTFDAPASVNTPILLEAAIPADTPEGIYRGVITVNENGAQIADIPVELRVFGFNLPATAHLKTFFYARHNEFNAFDRRNAEQVTDDIFQLLKEHRINGNQGETIPTPEWTIENNHLVIKSFTAFDNFVRKRLEKDGMKVIPVPYLYFFGDTGGFYRSSDLSFDRSMVFGEKYDSTLGKQYLQEYAGAFYDHVSQTFPQVEFLAYLWDEPRLGNVEELATLIAAIKKGAPKMKLFLTAPLSFAETFPEIDVWCEPYQAFFDKSFHLLAPNAEFWIYNWSASLSEDEYFQARLFPHLAYLNDASGALLWQIFDIPGRINPLNHIEKTYDCGSATIVFPDPMRENHFLSSQRFIQMREGIDDFDYMKILENLVDAEERGSGREYVKKFLMQIVCGPGMEYYNNPSALEKIRLELASEIEKRLRNNVTGN